MHSRSLLLTIVVVRRFRRPLAPRYCASPGSDVVLLMLLDSSAVDQVLQRGTPSLAAMLSGRIVVNMSSVEPG